MQRIAQRMARTARRTAVVGALVPRAAALAFVLRGAHAPPRRAGFSAVSTVGIPVVLTHAQLISGAQLALALPSALLLAGTAVAYGMLSRGGGDDGYGYVYGY